MRPVRIATRNGVVGWAVCDLKAGQVVTVSADGGVEPFIAAPEPRAIALSDGYVLSSDGLRPQKPTP